MEKLIDFLDSTEYARAVSWGEHIVLVYKLALGRSPTTLEFYLLSELREDIGLARSTALSVALREDAPCPTWAKCRDFLNRIDIRDFRIDPEVRKLTRELVSVPPSRLREILEQMTKAAPRGRSVALRRAQPMVPGVQYNTYFGYLHAHSELSDGQGSPQEAYAYAREEGDLDFFALTDHGEFLLIWPWQHKWEELIIAAQAAYQPGSYVTLWGFEWSNPLLGHINVINTPDFTDTISDFSLTDIYQWIIDRREAFGRFNHPGEYDYLHLEFLHLKRYSDAVPQMVGIETWNGTKGFDKYFYDGSWRPSSEQSYWDVGNGKGWHLGALGGQDNHSPDWGTRNQFRTAVLAESLTREHVLEAYLNRRFYATEDKDLYLDLRCRGYPMGARLSNLPREFEVSAWDGSGDTFQEVRLYRNGDLLQTLSVSGVSIQATFSDPSRSRSDFYYVVVRQTDDNDSNGRNDEAITSPIWID
jgi:hypothetical protein